MEFKIERLGDCEKCKRGGAQDKLYCKILVIGQFGKLTYGIERKNIQMMEQPEVNYTSLYIEPRILIQI